jgi:hypothetical protein
MSRWFCRAFSRQIVFIFLDGPVSSRYTADLVEAAKIDGAHPTEFKGGSFAPDQAALSRSPSLPLSGVG